jgi:hypothetical protein
MTKLSDDLKKMLSGLACQDAGEYLSTQDKMKILGIDDEAGSDTPAPRRARIKRSTTHRIALISDGRGQGAPLDYAIESCARMEANIDLLIQGTVDAAKIASLEERIGNAGVGCRTIQLGSKPVEDIFNYIHNQPSLIFIVTIPENEAARLITEELIPKRGGRMPVPLVLIEDRATNHRNKQSAA